MKTIYTRLLTVFVAVAGTALSVLPTEAAQTYTDGDVFVGFRSTTSPNNAAIFNIGNVSQFTNTVSFSNFSFGGAGTTGADWQISLARAGTATRPLLGVSSPLLQDNTPWHRKCSQ